MNKALVQWFSKNKPTVEISVFDAEFVAMKQGIDVLRGLRYKLRMISIPISGPSYIYGTYCHLYMINSRPENEE